MTVAERISSQVQVCGSFWRLWRDIQGRKTGHFQEFRPPFPHLRAFPANDGSGPIIEPPEEKETQRNRGGEEGHCVLDHSWMSHACVVYYTMFLSQKKRIAFESDK